MQLDFAQTMAAVRSTVSDPRRAARWIIAQDFALNTAILGLVVAGVLTSVLSGFVMLIAPDGMFAVSPVQLAILQVVGLFIGAGLITVVGGWFGGKGKLKDAIALLAWVEGIMILLQGVQIVALIILPPVTVLLALFGVGLMFWLAVNFIAELHGFSSIAKVFFGILGTVFVISFILAGLLGSVMGV